MSSITLETQRSASVSSSSFPIPQSQSKSPSLQLNSEQEAHFGKKIAAKHIFQSTDGTIRFHFDLLEFFQLLIADLQAKDVVIDRILMTGSQMVDVLLKSERPHGDQDFLILIGEKGNRNQDSITEIFLEVLFKISVERWEKLPNGKLNCLLKNGLQVEIKDKKDLFRNGALDALGSYNGNMIITTIPLVNFKIDITFGWNLETSCVLSSDSFQGDILPFLDGTGRLNSVSAADGYDADKSLRLVKSRYFYVDEKQVSKLRHGLSRYIHAITSGCCPIDYSLEEAFLRRWLEEYPLESTPSSKFLNDISKDFKKHYQQNLWKITAYLINLRTFFFSKKFTRKEAWLAKFDAFAQNYIGGPRVLETALFWNHQSSLLQSRLDCAKGSTPGRFRIDIQGASILIEAPWNEILEALTSEEFPQISYLQYTKEKLLARLMTLPVIQDNLVGKLLILLVRGKQSEFISELARHYNELTSDQISLFEKLWHLFTLEGRFSFGQSQLSFLTNASLAGFFDQVKMVFPFGSLPEKRTEAEEKMLLLLATTPESMQFMAEQALPLLTAHLILRVPTQKLFELIKVLSLPALNWPTTWIDFIEQNPANFVPFSKSATFEHLHNQVALKMTSNQIAARAAQDFLVDKDPTLLSPSKEVLLKVQHLPLLSWPATWISFIEQNTDLYELFLSATTFSPEFRSKVTVLLLKRENEFLRVWPIACRAGSVPAELKEITSGFKKAGPKEIYSLGEGLLNLFEINKELAIQLTAHFFKTVSFASFEKASASMPLCWKLLQLSSGVSVRHCPLSLSSQINFFTVVMKSDGELLPLLAQLITDTSLTPTQRTEIVSDLIEFSRFLHPKLQLTSRTQFAQNFLRLILDLLQDTSMLEKRVTIMQRLSSFSGGRISLPSLRQTAHLSFHDCLEPLAKDLLGAPEILKHYVQWLVKMRTTIPKAEAVLHSLAPTLEKEHVFSEDSLALFAEYTSLSSSLIEQVLSTINNPELVLAFLKRQDAPYALVALFERYALKSNNWTMASELALEIKRLGGKDLTVQILPSKIQIRHEHLPFIEKLIDAGVDGELIWKAANISRTDRNIKLQIQLAKVCTKKSPSLAIGEYLVVQMDKKIPSEFQLDLITSDIIPIATLWKALQPELVKEAKIAQAFFNRLVPSSEYVMKFQILAELLAVLSPEEASEKATKLFKTLTESIKARSIQSPECEQFVCDDPIAEAILIHELLDSQVTLPTIWGLIRHQPKNNQFLDAFLDRLKINTNYVVNFELLLQVIKTISYDHLRGRHIELFNHFVLQMSDLPIENLWVAIKPFIYLKRTSNGTSSPIPLSEWEKVFTHSLRKSELQQERAENIPLLRAVTFTLFASPLWSESSFLFLVRGLAFAASEYSPEALSIWESFVAISPKIVKNPDAHKEASKLLETVYKTLSQKANLNLSPSTIASYNWTQTPFLGKEDFIQSIEILIKDRPADFGLQCFAKWTHFTQIDWDLEGFLRLLTLLEKISTHNDHSLTIACQFILLFQFERYIKENPQLKIPDFYLKSVIAFHKASLNVYSKSLSLTVEDGQGVPFPYASQLNEFLAGLSNEHQMFEMQPQIRKIPLRNPRSSLLTRMIEVHATLLKRGKAESRKTVFLHPQYWAMATELFEQYRALHFFIYYDPAAFTSILRQLFEVLSTGKTEDISFLMNELTISIKKQVFLKEISRESKNQLFTIFVRDILEIKPAEDKDSYPALCATFEFIKDALVTPEWELETSSALEAHMKLLISFNKNQDLSRSLKCAANILPKVNKYILINPDQVSLNGNLKDFYILIAKIVRDKELDKAIEAGLKSRAHAKLASTLQKQLKEGKKNLVILEQNEKFVSNCTLAAALSSSGRKVKGAVV